MTCLHSRPQSPKKLRGEPLFLSIFVQFLLLLSRPQKVCLFLSEEINHIKDPSKHRGPPPFVYGPTTHGVHSLECTLARLPFERLGSSANSRWNKQLCGGHMNHPWNKHTVDGRNPAPPGMVKTLYINNGIIIILGGAGFLPSTVAPDNGWLEDYFSFLGNINHHGSFICTSVGKVKVLLIWEGNYYWRYIHV